MMKFGANVTKTALKPAFNWHELVRRNSSAELFRPNDLFGDLECSSLGHFISTSGSALSANEIAFRSELFEDLEWLSLELYERQKSGHELNIRRKCI